MCDHPPPSERASARQGTSARGPRRGADAPHAMPKRKAEFSDGAVVATLIQQVRERPCLWNSDDGNYKDRSYVATAWEEISKSMDLQVDAVRTKWKNLRDFFKKLIRKRDIKDVDDYLGRWRHFKSLWFLFKPEILINDSCEEDTTNTSTDLVKCEPTDLYEAEGSMEQLAPIADKKRRTDNEEDFDLMFLKSLTPFLKQMEPIRKLVVRNKIQEILLNEIAAQATTEKNFN